MKKLALTIAGVCLLGTLLQTQTHTFPALDTNNNFTGINTFAGNTVLASMTSCTVNGFFVAGSSCYATIQAAINATGSTGGTVFVPHGTTFDSGGLAITASHPVRLLFDQGTFAYSGSTTPMISCLSAGGVIIEGSGSGRTGDAGSVITVSNTSVTAITVTGCDGVQIKNLDIQGPSSGTGIGIRVASTRFLLMSDHVTAFGSHGVWIDGATANANVGEINHVRSDHNGGNGFYSPNSNGGSTSYIAADAAFNTGDGFTIGSGSNMFISTNTNNNGSTIGYHFLNGAVSNSGSIFSNAPGDELIGAQFESGSNSNTLFIDGSASPVTFNSGANNNTLLSPTAPPVTNNGTGNRYYSTTQTWNTLNTTTFSVGVAGTTAGTINVSNATSGSIAVNPPTGALGSPVVTWPGQTGTLTEGAICGTIAANGACANTASNGTAHWISGIAVLTGGTSTITGISPVFASSSSFYCVTSDITTITNPSKGVPASGSTVTFTGTGTDNISFICSGN